MIPIDRTWLRLFVFFSLECYLLSFSRRDISWILISSEKILPMKWSIFCIVFEVLRIVEARNIPLSGNFIYYIIPNLIDLLFPEYILNYKRKFSINSFGLIKLKVM